MTQDTNRCTLVVISSLYARNGEARDDLCKHWSKSTKESASQIQLDLRRSFQISEWCNFHFPRVQAKLRVKLISRKLKGNSQLCFNSDLTMVFQDSTLRLV